MTQLLKVRKNTIDCLQHLIINQGIDLVKKIGKYKKWSEDDIESIIKQFVTDTPVDIQVITETKRGGKKANLTDNERCCAKVATGDRCSRSKKKNLKFCGIHQRMANSEKGLVYGYVDVVPDKKTSKSTTKKRHKKTSKKKKTIKVKTIESDDEIKLDDDLYTLGMSDNDSDSDSDDDEVRTTDIIIDEITYLMDIDTNDIYCKSSGDLLGKYNPNTQKIIE